MGYRYIGSKTTVMSEVLSSIKMLYPTGTRVCDLMCGTGVVSEALRGCGYRVIAADVMTYSYHHARTLLLFVSEPTFDSARDFIVEHGVTSGRARLNQLCMDRCSRRCRTRTLGMGTSSGSSAQVALLPTE